MKCRATQRPSLIVVGAVDGGSVVEIEGVGAGVFCTDGDVVIVGAVDGVGVGWVDGAVEGMGVGWVDGVTVGWVDGMTVG